MAPSMALPSAQARWHGILLCGHRLDGARLEEWQVGPLALDEEADHQAQAQNPKVPDFEGLDHILFGKIYGIRPGTLIVFELDGLWLLGRVGQYELWREAAKIERVKKSNARRCYRRYLQQPTWHERLMQDDHYQLP